VKEGERNLSRTKKIKKLIKKVQKIRRELMKKRMLCFFELEKKLNKKYTRGGKKNDKTLA